MSIDDKLGEAKDLATQMESVSKTRLFTLLCCKCSTRYTILDVIQCRTALDNLLDWFQIHVIIEVEVVQILWNCISVLCKTFEVHNNHTFR